MKKLLLSICLLFALSLSAQTVNLYLPSSGTTINGISTALQWYDVAGESGYTYQVDTVNTFDSPNLQSESIGAVSTSSPILVGVGGLTFGTTYYWRVAILFGETQGDWSAVRNFITVGQPSLYEPSNGITLNGLSGALRWYDISGETGFVYQLDTVSTFDSPNLQSGNVPAYTSTSGTPAAGFGDLAFGTTYYWRVAFLNGTEQSAWSAIKNFNTIANVSLYTPENGETVNINPGLRYYDASGETGYILQLDTVNTFDSPTLQTVTLGAFNESSGLLNVGVGTLAFGTTYYWRVAILNDTAQSAWSTTRNFTTVGQPSLYSPENAETINGITAFLQCYNYSGETGYVYQLDTVNTFDSANLQTINHPAQTSEGFPTVGVGGLAFGTTYYWRVAILSTLGQSGWSSIRNFNTVVKPSLNFPNNGAVNVGNAAALSWYNIAGESGFVYQIDTNSSFNSPNLQTGLLDAYTSTIGYPAIGVNGLLDDTTYFWRVAFLNGEMQSEWSNTWLFATGATILGTANVDNRRFSIYPNPTNGVLYIGGLDRNAKFQISSADGKAMSSGTIHGGQQLDLSSFSNGMYFVRIDTEEASAVYKIVKR